MRCIVLIDSNDEYYTELAEKIYLNCDINSIELIEMYDEED